MKIIYVKGLQVLDSRGNPTLQVEVLLDDGSKGKFRVPSGASTGVHEALELRDEDEKLFCGRSVYKCIENINRIRDHLIDKDFNQEKLDYYLIELDGTENKSNLGANTILGISCAFARACAKYYSIPLYEYLYKVYNNIELEQRKEVKLPNIHLFANVINGGLHSGNDLQIQEFMLVPTQKEIFEKIRAISEIYQNLKKIIKNDYSPLEIGLGDEGGFAPNISKPKEALDLLVRAILDSGYENEVKLALDCAASDFYNLKNKKYRIEKNKSLNYTDLTSYYNDLIRKYPIISIEDPMAEDDFEGFSYYMKNREKLQLNNPLTMSKELAVVGDDLLVTNPKRIKEAQKKKLCNSLLLKINQIGTLTESFEAARLAKKANWHIIVSHRSGETTDAFIADLAVALSSSIKLGAPARGERVAKYNRLIEIYSKGS